jgi:mannose-6-phosphate isomerase-like protein (cupin superfamily)
MKASVIRPDPANEYGTDERCHILEMSNSENDEDLSIARARVEPGVTTAFHRCEGTAERYVILEGKGRVEIEGLSPQDVGVGDVVVIPPSAEQRIENTGNGDLVFLALCTPRFRPENYKHTE